MPRADDLVAIQLAVAQRPVVVGAYVANSKIISGQIEYHNLIFSDLQEDSLAVRDFV
jgi:hypothetical protein